MNPASHPSVTWEMKSFHARLVGLSLTLVCMLACGGPQVPMAPMPAPVAEPTPAPSWIWQLEYSETQICGLGVAGPGFPGSPYPRENATDRALMNLAGSIETAVQEALIAVQRESGTAVELARLLQVDHDLLTQVRAAAVMEYWVDALGEGPFAQSGFTYARACVDSRRVGDSRLIAAELRDALSQFETKVSARDGVPAWLDLSGRQPGGRLCAIGYSEPAFYADQTFANVVDSVRGQLAETLLTLVSEYQQDVVGDSFEVSEVMTVSTSQALSEGVVVTHYWYDVEGDGPYQKKGTTYGWGCAYPTRVLSAAATEAASSLPPEAAEVLRAVKHRAARAFEDLEALEGR